MIELWEHLKLRREKVQARKNLVTKFKEKKFLGLYTYRWEYNIKIRFREMSCYMK
jgi:hypothetical protein